MYMHIIAVPEGINEDVIFFDPGGLYTISLLWPRVLHSKYRAFHENAEREYFRKCFVENPSTTVNVKH